MLDAANAALVDTATERRTVEHLADWLARGKGWPQHLDQEGVSRLLRALLDQPAVNRQVLTHPSSLVDFLREWARFHGIRPVTSTEAYRAAERFAEALQQAIVPQVPTCSTCREPVQLVGVEPLLSTEHVDGSTDHKARIGGGSR